MYNLSLPLQSKYYYPNFIVSEDTEYSMLNHNRKEYGRDCVYVELNPFAVQQELTHCKSTVHQ